MKMTLYWHSEPKGNKNNKGDVTQVLESYQVQIVLDSRLYSLTPLQRHKRELHRGLLRFFSFNNLPILPFLHTVPTARAM